MSISSAWGTTRFYDKKNNYEAMIKKATPAIQKMYKDSVELRDISDIVKKRKMTAERKLRGLM